MDQKILKQSLKEAKEAIKNGKYPEAIKLCKVFGKQNLVQSLHCTVP
jgi:hypothetical protein